MFLEEVAPMEIYTTGRPSVLLAPACAPFAYGPESLVAARRAPLSQVHQVQIQAELARNVARGGSTTSTTSNTVSPMGRDGFVGSNGSVVKTDGASGVPPRGRPV
ncbi:hypothetical protein [Actinoplanes sp. NBRC 103695]|uniref:hypothetical protein n=1 Tax=Actinoplanes sp. NBRC 103695 TaxID=3032202 RepID=UPI00249FFEE1|nr:hypothetical protein [Actinoplanes sp. NBRC 103695]GLY95787.1 hypothetical protein Acsp02_30420 [Actinoplanes sp. NBRC 103695]